MEKFSVYNNPMGGAPPLPPPLRPSPINNKFDSPLSRNYMTATTRVEDVICMQYLSKTEERESVMKGLMLLLHSWMPKWDLPAAGEKTGKEKPALLAHTQKVTTLEKVTQALYSVTKGVEKTYNRVVNLFQTVVMPPLQMMAKMAQAVSNTYAKVEQGVTQWITVTAQTIAQPIEKAWEYISNLFETKISMPLQKAWERTETIIQNIFTRLEKEGERIVAFLTPPIESVKKQMEKYMTKVMDKARELSEPVRKTFNKLVELSKPYQEAISRKAEEISDKIREVFTKQIEKVLPPLEGFKNVVQAATIQVAVTVWQAVPTASLALGFNRLAQPFKRVKGVGKGFANAGLKLGKQLLGSGQKAFAFVAERVVRGVATIGSYLERFLRKLFRMLLKLIKIVVAISYHIGLFMLTIPKKLIQLGSAIIHFFANLTILARNLVSSN
jgi:hypothetical protein